MLIYVYANVLTIFGSNELIITCIIIGHYYKIWFMFINVRQMSDSQNKDLAGYSETGISGKKAFSRHSKVMSKRMPRITLVNLVSKQCFGQCVI